MVDLQTLLDEKGLLTAQSMRRGLINQGYGAEEFYEILGKLPKPQLLKLKYDWSFWARPDQIPPPGKWRHWMLRSGRGVGKTRSGAEWVIDRAKKKKGPIAIIGETAGDVRNTMVEGQSGVMSCAPPWFMPKYEPSKRRLTFPNGVIATTYSGDEPGQLRGPNTQTVWADELAKWKYCDEAFDNMELGLRIGEPRCIITTTPRPIPIIKRLGKDPDTVTTQVSTYVNIANLSEEYIRYVVRRYEGTRLARQELYGETLEEVAGALWSPDVIEDTRVKRCPMLRSIVVAIDPAEAADERTSEWEENDTAEVGIVAAGLGDYDSHGYVLADASGFWSPGEWARRAVQLYRSLGANYIVAERNKGGKMVEHTIHTVDDRIPVKLVWASQGKDVRAEPVSALYEQRRVHHVGLFGEMESQMCSFVPKDRIRTRLDRMDALVYSITQLMCYDEDMPHLAQARTNRRPRRRA